MISLLSKLGLLLTPHAAVLLGKSDWLREQYVAGIIKIYRPGSPIRYVVVIKVFGEDDLTEEVACRSHQGGSKHDRAKVTNL